VSEELQREAFCGSVIRKVVDRATENEVDFVKVDERRVEVATKNNEHVGNHEFRLIVELEEYPSDVNPMVTPMVFDFDVQIFELVEVETVNEVYNYTVGNPEFFVRTEHFEIRPEPLQNPKRTFNYEIAYEMDPPELAKENTFITVNSGD